MARERQKQDKSKLDQSPILIPRSSLLPPGPLPPDLKADLSSHLLRTGAVKRLREEMDGVCGAHAAGSESWQRRVRQRIEEIIHEQVEDNAAEDAKLDEKDVMRVLMPEIWHGVEEKGSKDQEGGGAAKKQDRMDVAFPIEARERARDLIAKELLGSKGVVEVRGEIVDEWVV